MAASVGPSPARERPVRVTVEPPITLGQFLKLAALTGTGGEAKQLIAAGLVRVNGCVDTRRGRRLVSGDIVEVRGVTREVVIGQTGPSKGSSAC